MRAIVLDRPGSFRVAEVPDPTPGPGQIVVKVDACGVCGTDMHIMDGEFPPTPYPITPGHEFAGTIVAVAGDVKMDLPVGALVAVDPSLYCGYCRRCRSGRGNLCENWAAIGDTVTARSPSTSRSPRSTRTAAGRDRRAGRRDGGAAGLRGARPAAARPGVRRHGGADRGRHDGAAAAAVAGARGGGSGHRRGPGQRPARGRPQARGGPGRRRRRRARGGAVRDRGRRDRRAGAWSTRQPGCSTGAGGCSSSA
jgi:hypothetical protein